VLFVGDDWAEDHHDVEVMDAAGRRLARARLEEGMAGMSRLHALIGQHLDLDEQVGEGVCPGNGVTGLTGRPACLPGRHSDDREDAEYGFWSFSDDRENNRQAG
jgi:hypothetical protein